MYRSLTLAYPDRLLSQTSNIHLNIHHDRFRLSFIPCLPLIESWTPLSVIKVVLTADPYASTNLYLYTWNTGAHTRNLTKKVKAGQTLHRKQCLRGLKIIPTPPLISLLVCYMEAPRWARAISSSSLSRAKSVRKRKPPRSISSRSPILPWRQLRARNRSQQAWGVIKTQFWAYYMEQTTTIISIIERTITMMVITCDITASVALVTLEMTVSHEHLRQYNYAVMSTETQVYVAILQLQEPYGVPIWLPQFFETPVGTVYPVHPCHTNIVSQKCLGLLAPNRPGGSPLVRDSLIASSYTGCHQSLQTV